MLSTIYAEFHYAECRYAEFRGALPATIRPGTNSIKLFTVVIDEFCNKIECVSLASLYNLVSCFRVRFDTTSVKHLVGDPL
jgi:hypothetical protein